MNGVPATRVTACSASSAVSMFDSCTNVIIFIKVLCNLTYGVTFLWYKTDIGFSRPEIIMPQTFAIILFFNSSKILLLFPNPCYYSHIILNK